MRLYRDVAPAMLFASVLGLAILLTVLGCREDTESPTGPEPGPELSSTATEALSFVQVSTSLEHTCGVTTDNRAYCWGYNYFGQLGDGTAFPTNTQRLTPVAVAGGLRFRQVNAGDYYTCGLTTDNRAYCWGNNDDGRLGDGTTTFHSTPVAVTGGLQFRMIRAATDHTCGVTIGRAAYCWGSNQFGQLGDGGIGIVRLTPTPVAGGLLFRQLSTGGFNTCGATTDNKGYCWGYNAFGQLGDGGTTSRADAPVAVAGGLHFVQVVAGGSSTCGVTTADLAYCWGDNFSGELGDGSTTQRLSPRAVAGGLQFSGVAVGANYACGVTPNDRMYCWGNNYYGQLGDGTTIQRHQPVAVAGEHAFHQISASLHTCAVTSDNRAFCWGPNFYGQLGDGTTQRRLRPRPVVGPM